MKFGQKSTFSSMPVHLAKGKSRKGKGFGKGAASGADGPQDRHINPYAGKGPFGNGGKGYSGEN